jgi:hypothetical protein
MMTLGGGGGGVWGYLLTYIKNGAKRGWVVVAKSLLPYVGLSTEDPQIPGATVQNVIAPESSFRIRYFSTPGLVTVWV